MVQVIAKAARDKTRLRYRDPFASIECHAIDIINVRRDGLPAASCTANSGKLASLGRCRAIHDGVEA